MTTQKIKATIADEIALEQEYKQTAERILRATYEKAVKEGTAGNTKVGSRLIDNVLDTVRGNIVNEIFEKDYSKGGVMPKYWPCVQQLLQGEQPSLGIWFDFEAPECLDAFNPTGICSRFIVECNEAGCAAGIYASLSTLTDVLNLNLLADYVPFWCAQYDEECNFKDDYPDKILAGWQYSDSQYIGDTNVDMNEWYAEDW